MQIPPIVLWAHRARPSSDYSTPLNKGAWTGATG